MLSANIKYNRYDILPWLRDVHVFQWDGSPDIRLPLEKGWNVWSKYLEKVNSTGRDSFAMLEFVKDNNPQNFHADAAMLKNWLAKINKQQQMT